MLNRSHPTIGIAEMIWSIDWRRSDGAIDIGFSIRPFSGKPFPSIKRSPSRVTDRNDDGFSRPATARERFTDCPRGDFSVPIQERKPRKNQRRFSNMGTLWA